VRDSTIVGVKTSSPISFSMSVDLRTRRQHHDSVLEMIGLIARALALACRGHHELVLENIALRQSSVRRGDHSQ